jgi:CubicO group peptidase (beta-lactamase class C family)
MYVTIQEEEKRREEDKFPYRWLLFGVFLWVFCGQIRGEGIPPLLNHKDLQTVVADLQELIPQLMKQARIPGLQIALIRDGRIVWHQNYGQRNATTAEPVTDDTIFEAGSRKS